MCSFLYSTFPICSSLSLLWLSFGVLIRAIAVREREREGDIGSISLHNIESSPKGPTIDENDQVWGEEETRKKKRTRRRLQIHWRRRWTKTINPEEENMFSNRFLCVDQTARHWPSECDGKLIEFNYQQRTKQNGTDHRVLNTRAGVLIYPNGRYISTGLLSTI